MHQAAELYGSDRTVWMLATALLSSGEWWPILVVPRDGPLVGALTRSGIEVHIAEVMNVSRASASLRGLLRLLQGGLDCVRALDGIVAGRPVALVHSNTIAVLGGAVWAARRKRPHVWHVHEIITAPAAARRGFPWLVRKLADRVIANSRQTRAWLVGMQPRIERKSTVVFNGLPPHAEPASELIRAARARLGAGDSDVLISLVGRLNYWKGHHVLLNSIAALSKRGRARIKVAIVGSPFEGQEHVRTELAGRSTALELDGIVRFLPFVDDVWPIWHGTDIAVVPSTEPEPFGLVAIEAMAAAVPVVASAHGGLLDIVDDGTTGMLVKPGDSQELAAALQALIADPGRRRAMGAAGRERQRALFSMDAYFSGIEAVYGLAASGTAAESKA